MSKSNADAEFYEQVFRSELTKNLEKSGTSGPEVSQALGRARSFVTRKVSGAVGLKVTEICSIFSLPGLSLEKYLRSILARIASLDSPDLFLQPPIDIPAARYANLLVDATSSPLSPAEQSEVREAVPQRLFEPIPKNLSIQPPQQYYELLEHLVAYPRTAYSLARAAAKESAAMCGGSSRDILEHSCLVHAWAIAALRIGRVNLSAHLTSRAILLHGAANLSATFPPLLRTASAIFHELAECGLSVSTAQHAFVLSPLCEGRTGKAKSALRLSSMYTAYGNSTRAIQILAACSEVPDRLRFRFEYTHALLLFNSGQVADAEDRLTRCSPRNRHEQLIADWLMARIRSAQSREDEAMTRYRELLDQSTGHLAPIDRLMIFLDLVPLLQNASDKDAIKLFARHVLPDLEQLEVNKATSSLREELISAATRGTLKKGLEREARRLLGQAR